MLVVLSGVGSALSCALSSTEELFMEHDAIFSGKIIEIEEFTNYEGLTFEADKFWKGSKWRNEDGTITIKTSIESEWDSYNFVNSEEYLIYSYLSDDELTVSRICPTTKGLSNAGEDIEILDRLEESLNDYTTLQEYYDSIEYSCETRSDCVVKDVHNCCGYFPKCVSKGSVVNPNFVRESCDDDGLASVCGWTSIDYCACENNLCVEKQGKLELECTSDLDCPQIQCVRAPCPEYECNSGVCVLKENPTEKGECEILWTKSDICSSGLVIKEFIADDIVTYGICVKPDGSSECDAKPSTCECGDGNCGNSDGCNEKGECLEDCKLGFWKNFTNWLKGLFS
jgi:hypothetical protein